MVVNARKKGCECPEKDDSSFTLQYCKHYAMCVCIHFPSTQWCIETYVAAISSSRAAAHFCQRNRGQLELIPPPLTMYTMTSGKSAKILLGGIIIGDDRGGDNYRWWHTGTGWRLAAGGRGDVEVRRIKDEDSYRSGMYRWIQKYRMSEKRG